MAKACFERWHTAALAEMHLWLLGGLHDGLGLLEQSKKWLRDTAGAYGRKPRFVALEWHRDAHRALMANKATLAAELSQRWPVAPAEVIDLACSTLCWEAEAGLTAFRRAPHILWLEEGIDQERESIPINDPKFYLREAKAAPLALLMGNSANAKSVSSAAAAFAQSEKASWPNWERAAADRRCRMIRDRRWATLLERAMRGHKRDWGVAIIGAAHATRLDRDMLPVILDRMGLRFKRYFLERAQLVAANHLSSGCRA